MRSARVLARTAIAVASIGLRARSSTTVDGTRAPHGSRSSPIRSRGRSTATTCGPAALDGVVRHYHDARLVASLPSTVAQVEALSSSRRRRSRWSRATRRSSSYDAGRDAARLDDRGRASRRATRPGRLAIITYAAATTTQIYVGRTLLGDGRRAAHGVRDARPGDRARRAPTADHVDVFDATAS